MRNRILRALAAVVLTFPGAVSADDMEEAWASAGRIAGPAAAQTMVMRNGPSRELDPWQKELLRPLFGGRVDSVRVVFSAVMLNEICGNGKCMRLAGVEAAAQAYEGRIYVKDPYRQWDFPQVALLAHEMQHVKQCDDAGSMAECGSRYFRAYYRANYTYINTAPEVEAYSVGNAFRTKFKEAAGTTPCGTWIAFKSWTNSKFVVAEWGGGRELLVNRDTIGQWETFRIHRQNCTKDVTYSTILADDPVYLSSYWGFYVSAEGGGGGEVNARRVAPAQWETFKLRKVSGSAGSQIKSGDIVAIQTYNGRFLTAEGGGGSTMRSSATQILDWEKFTVQLINWPP